MKKYFYLLIAFIITLCVNIILIKKFTTSSSVESRMQRIFSEIDRGARDSAAQIVFQAAPLVLGVDKGEDFTLVDKRVANLKKFFRQHDSPLYDLASYIVEVSDKYEFDYRLLPAIAMTESTLCRSIPADSYNCWGWGINSTQTLRFSSFKEAIEAVARGLRIGYIDKGLVTPEAIMAKYAPHSTSWASRINHFLSVLD